MPDREPELAGQVAVVTGGGRGVGRGIVEALAERGMSVAVVGRSSAEIETVAAAAREVSGAALAVEADVTDRAAVESMVSRVLEELGPIDLLVNNAGRAQAVGPPWTVDPESWWADVEVNLRGTFLCTHAVMQSMVERRAGRIVNVATLAAAAPYPFVSGYASSKAAVLRFTDSLAVAAAPHGISAFSISPGLVDTKLLGEMTNSPAGKKWLPEFEQRTDWVPPAAAGQLVARLASGVADQLTGRFIHVLDDLDQLIGQADEIVAADIRILRLPTGLEGR
jgi:NAD(P)-dependent dehydrogenase (short-subunit alcohol dehydrogenase family)